MYTNTPKTLKNIVLLLAVVLPLLLLAACGGDKKDSSEPPAGVEIDLQPIELTYYSSYTGNISERSQEGFMHDFGRFIQQVYPHISFKTIFGADTGQNLDAIVLDQVPIDFLMISPVGTHTFVELGLVSDISDLVRKYNFDESKVEPSSMQLIRSASGSNSLVGLPFEIISFVLFYNQTLFDEFGVDYPKDDMTWEEMLDLVRRMSRVVDNKQYRGFVTQQNLANTFRGNQLSLEPVNLSDDTAAFASNEWVNFLRTFIPLFQVPGNTTQGLGPNIVQNFLGERNIATILSYPSIFKQFPEDFQWDVVSSPKFSHLPTTNWQPVPLVMAPVANSPNRDQAFLAVSALLDYEVQLARARDMAIQSVLVDERIRQEIGAGVPALQGKNRQAFQVQNMAAPITFTEFTGLATGGINRAFLAVINGQKDLNTAVRDEVEVVNNNIQQAKEAK